MSRPSKIDINQRYFPQEEIRTDKGELCPYDAFFQCLEATFELSDIKSLCDLGCATGLLLKKVAENYPRIDLLGIEYFEYQKQAAAPSIQNCIEIFDLRDPWQGKGSYEIAVCTEVGEHIEFDYCDIFLENLKALCAKHLVMSWSAHADDLSKPRELHQHLNPLPFGAYVKLLERKGFVVNTTLSEAFRKVSVAFAHFHPWWRESVLVWNPPL